MLAFMLSLLGLVGLILWIRLGSRVSSPNTQRWVATTATWVILSFLLISGVFLVVGFGFGQLVNEFPNLVIFILLACTWAIYLAGQALGEQTQKSSPVAGSSTIDVTSSAAATQLLSGNKAPAALEPPTGYGPTPR